MLNSRFRHPNILYWIHHRLPQQLLTCRKINGDATFCCRIRYSGAFNSNAVVYQLCEQGGSTRTALHKRPVPYSNQPSSCQAAQSRVMERAAPEVNTKHQHASQPARRISDSMPIISSKRIKPTLRRVSTRNPGVASMPICLAICTFC